MCVCVRVQNKEQFGIPKNVDANAPQKQRKWNRSDDVRMWCVCVCVRACIVLLVYLVDKSPKELRWNIFFAEFQFSLRTIELYMNGETDLFCWFVRTVMADIIQTACAIQCKRIIECKYRKDIDNEMKHNNNNDKNNDNSCMHFSYY